MGNIFSNIKPGGMLQKDEVDLLYMIVSSIAGICAKLDSDGGITDTDYTALCYTAILLTKIIDHAGNVTGAPTGARGEKTISLNGMTADAWNELMYQIYNAWETLTEKLDLDAGITDTDYEANCYTAKFLHMVKNKKGSILGNGNTYYFNPVGRGSEQEIINNYYNILDALETLTEQLDADGGITDTNYEALWFTATILLRVKDSKDNGIGVSR